MPVHHATSACALASVLELQLVVLSVRPGDKADRAAAAAVDGHRRHLVLLALLLRAQIAAMSSASTQEYHKQTDALC